MIKLLMFSDKDVLWHIGYNKEAEMQRAAETAPQMIFFLVDYVEIVHALLDEGLTMATIARDHLNMSTTDLNKAYTKAFQKEYVSCKQQS